MEEDDFIQNWPKLKPLVLLKWNRLKHTLFDEHQPDIEELIQKIGEKYDEPEIGIRQEIENLYMQVIKDD